MLGVTSTEAARMKELEREERELKRANEILKKAAAFLPRRSSTANRWILFSGNLPLTNPIIYGWLISLTVRPCLGGVRKMLPELEHVWNSPSFYKEEIKRVPAFCYGKARAEAAATCCTLAG
jgi:hypothetical protein